MNSHCKKIITKLKVGDSIITDTPEILEEGNIPPAIYIENTPN